MRKKLKNLPEAVQAAHVGARGQVRAAVILAVATVLGAILGPIAGVSLGVLQYTGPGGSESTGVGLTPETTTVTVTADPSGLAMSPPPPSGATYLVDLNPVVGSSDYETGIARINTQSFGRSVTDFASCRRERKLEFQLSRRFTQFTAMVGPSNQSETGTIIAFAASVDGRRIDPVFVEVGSVEEFTFDVTNGFRLVLTYISSELSDGACPDPAIAVWGDARLS